MLKLPFALVTVISISLLPFVAPGAGAQQQEPSRPSSFRWIRQSTTTSWLIPRSCWSIRNFDLHRKAAEQPQAQRKIKANLAALQSDSPALLVGSDSGEVIVVPSALKSPLPGARRRFEAVSGPLMLISCALSAAPVKTVNGLPVWATPVPATVQPPRTVRSTRFPSLDPGSS